MQIRQLALHYRPEADRILLRVNATEEQQFSVWLTRRLSARLWPHLSGMVMRIGVAQEMAQAAPHAILMPEAQSMLAQSARDRALREADFKTPFEEQANTLPLGPEPLLATEVQLTPLAQGQLRVVITDSRQRRVQLQLTDVLATAVRELMLKALQQADWGLDLAGAQNNPAASTPSPRVLN